MTRHPLSRRIVLALVVALSAAPAAWSQAPNNAERRAFLTVRVHENAKLTVDGTPTTQKGSVRRFFSPELEPGKTYHYTLAAEWMPSNYETFTVKRKVEVTAGKRVEVDLRKAEPEKGDTLFIRWVATPPKVIDAMMKLAGVGKDDVVYDLGCGRGEIVIAAVKKFNAKRGVGIDLDPAQVQKAKANAKEAGVEKKVEFRQGDVLQLKDLADATVVTLYMSDDLNKLLMPILKKQLKPGARIVSHRFTMGDWTPDKTETVDIEHDIPEEKLIHLWTIKK
jgi:uncharacterized protein (TIGR03000 family)